MTNFTSPYTIVANPHALAGRGGRLRKRGGQVVSFAPQMLDLCAGVSRVALGGLLVLGGMVAAPDAMAGGCSSDPASICSGPAASDGTDTPIVVSDLGNVSITTLPGFGLDTSDTAADAITLIGNNTSFTDDHASSISAQQTALNVSNGAGSATITSTGSLTGGVGGAGSGLIVNNAAGSGNILINVNDVQGQWFGIEAINNGVGHTSVNATGTITSLGQTGLSVVNSIGSGEIGVSVGAVNALGTGIDITNNGVGATTVTANGTVTSTNSGAIFVIHGGSGDAVDISAVDLNAGLDGIVVRNEGEGELNIDVSGTIIAGERGIDAYAGPDSTDVTINVNAIDSIDEAIFLRAEGTGDIAINATGAITSADSTAIFVTAASSTGDLTITTDGAVSGAGGILVFHTGDGALAINSSESITGTLGAGIAVLTDSAGGIDINTVDVSAEDIGIGVSNGGTGNTSITSTGTVTSNIRHGVDVLSSGAGSTVINTVDVSAVNGRAITVNQTAGNVEITSTGTLDADVGVNVATGSSTDSVTIAVNNVQSSNEGILVDHQGTGDVVITATGAITSADNAAISVNATSSSTGDVTITTDGAVSGAGGIVAVHTGDGALAINSSESITGTSGAGITVLATNAGGIDINTVDVSAHNMGIFAVNFGDGDASISSTGTITSDTGQGIQVVSVGAGSTAIDTVDINAVDGAAIGVFQYAGNVDITSTGTLDAEVGVYVQTGPASDSVSIDVNNVLSTDEGILVNHQGTGDVVITATGDIVAGSDGIRVDQEGEGDVVITTTGDIVAGSDGIDVNTYSGSTANIIINASNITADDNGIEIDSEGDGDITINVSGLIDSINSDGMNIDHEGAGALTITADGTITAGDDGISVFAAAGSGDIIINANNIVVDDEGVTIASYSDGAISVAAANISGDYSGINIFQDGSGSVSVEVSGTITSTGVSYQYGGNTYIDGGNGVSIWSEADVDLQVNDVEAYANGIRVSVANGANVEIVSTGTITAGDNGIDVYTDNNTGDILIQANNITAGDNGIEIDNFASDAVVDITVSGTVEGGNAAIAVYSYYGNAVTSIQNDGILRNSDQLSTSDAILISGSSADITNDGSIIGNITTSSADDAFLNIGTWNNVGGTSNFGGGNDLLTNSTTGIILGASDAATAEVTTIVGLANLNNNGLITLADGAAGDVFSTDGDATFSATSTLSVDIGGAGISDLFVAGGDVVLSDGALDVELVGALPTIGTEYTVLQGNTVTGEFDFDDQYYTAFLGLRDSYTPDSVVLSFTQLRDLADAGLTPNQISTANGLDSLPLTNGLLASVLYLNTDAEAQSAFDQLSGDIHPGVRTALAEDSRLPRNAVMERLSNPEGGAVWGQLFWNTGDSDGNRNTAPIKRETWGFIAGADAGLGENAVIGISGAYLSNDLDQRQRASDGKLETIHVLGYVGAQAGQFRVKAGVGYAWGNIETTRNVSFTGFSDKLTADYDATLFQAFAEAGIQLPIGGGYIEPIAQVAFLRAKTDGFTEAGGLAALTAQSEVEKSTISTIGARFSTSQSGNFSVGGLVGWQHSYGSIDPQTRFSFAGGDSFSIAGVPQSRNAGVANVEARFQLSPGSSIGLGYDGVLGTASQDHAAKLNFRFAF